MAFRTVPPEDWKIDSLVSKERSVSLYEDVDPQVLIEQTFSSASIIDCRIERGENIGLLEFVRARATFCISNVVILDKLFNGVSGYRAQYYLSAEEGIAFNRLMMDRFSPSIVSELTDQYETASASLDSPHSKIWITKEEPAFHGPDSRKLTVRLIEKQKAYCAALASSDWKLCSVTKSDLLVLGGFIHQKTQKYGVAEHKRLRSVELHMHGES